MARKGENIYKRKDGRWEARYIHHYENGKAKYKSIYGASYAEAKAKKLEELAKPESMRVSAVKQTVGSGAFYFEVECFITLRLTVETVARFCFSSCYMGCLIYLRTIPPNYR